jgi:glucose/arabinose dehydrogenase
MSRRLLAAACAAFALAACNGGNASTQAQAATTAAVDDRDFVSTEIARFDEPWAMTFLPDGRLLVTEQAGALKLLDPRSGRIGEITGVPEVDYGGQGGLGDVIVHPQFADNGIVYLSYVEAGEGDTRGAAVARARLELDEAGGGELHDLEVIWRQYPKVQGRGHYGHRLAIGPDGYLWITSGERQKFDPAQDMASNLGKIVRLNADGSLPGDNPFADEESPQPEVTAQIWSLGHRNPLGIAFDAQGRLWAHEMGPKGGDEFNLIERGGNYGYPIVSNGDHYDGRPIPDHSEQPRFVEPVITWTPVISPSGLVIYSGELFPEWRGDALIGGLSSQALVRVEFEGETAREAERYDMGERIRGVEQGPGGALFVLEDGEEARLLKLTPPPAPPAAEAE